MKYADILQLENICFSVTHFISVYSATSNVQNEMPLVLACLFVCSCCCLANYY